MRLPFRRLRARSWERWFVTPRRVPALTAACTWCGGKGADAVIEGEDVHLNVRPYCQRQREALRAHGRRA